jgi:hypothetical protein
MSRTGLTFYREYDTQPAQPAEHAPTFEYQPDHDLSVPAQNSRCELHQSARTYAAQSMYPTDRGHRPSFAMASLPSPVTIFISSQETKIGAVYIDQTNEYVFRCNAAGCAGATFGRVPELKRHYKTFHVGSVVWCPYPGCERSENVGTRPFSAARCDKLKEHVERVHGMSNADWA